MSDPNDTQSLVVYTEGKVQNLFGDDYPIIKRMFPNSKPLDLVLLFKTAKALNLNPILKELYALETGQGTQIYVGKAGLSRRLNEQGGFDVSYARGYDEIAKDGLTAKSKHQLSGKGFFVDCVLIHNGHKIEARAYWDEYSPIDPKGGSSWSKNPFSMLEKVSFCKAARHCLGINIPSMMEMGQDESEEENGDAPITVIPHVPTAENPAKGVHNVAVPVTQPTEGELIGSETKRVIKLWSGSEVYANDLVGKAASSPKFISIFGEKFSHANHMKNHLRKHFKVDSAGELNWEQLNAFYDHLYNDKHDGRWYSEEVESAVDVHRSLESKFKDKEASDVYNMLTERYLGKLVTANPGKWRNAMMTILSALNGIFPLPLSEEDKTEILDTLDSEIKNV